MTRAAVAVILPVRDQAELLLAGLPAFVGQAGAFGAEVVVVDDASSDGVADRAAAAGARVLRRAQAGGPYVARNEGWRSCAADILVFSDARCRPRPGWLENLVTRVVESGAGIVGGEVVALPGRSRASASFARNQWFSPRRIAGDAYRPFVGTCNMAVRRPVLETLGGFVEVRSGGDTDLCWRAQEQHVSEIGIADDAVVEWIPREGLRATLGQFRRYGSARRWLDVRHATPEVGRDVPSALRSVVRAVKDAPAVRRRDGQQSWSEVALDQLCNVAWWAGYRQAVRTEPSAPSGPG
ncbi:MAG TPA: glycosyltransferase [Mycobacteriales bacterium]|nr:glycosyltransferase [Mycobacteriales bacterium]